MPTWKKLALADSAQTISGVQTHSDNLILDLNTQNEGLIIKNTHYNSVIDFHRASTATARIQVHEPGAVHTSSFKFYTSDADSSAPNLELGFMIGHDKKLTTYGQTLAVGGTAAAPAYAFTDQASTGMYKPGTSQLYFSVAGTRKMRVEATQIVLEDDVTVNNTLHVAGSYAKISNATNPYLYIDDTNGAKGIFQAYDTHVNIGSDTNHETRIVQNNATAITIDSSKNVTLEGTLYVPSTIGHTGDTDNAIIFTTDVQTYYTEGVARLTLTSTRHTSGRPIDINTTYSDEQLRLMGTSPYIRFYEGGVGKAYLQWHSDGKVLLENQETSSRMDMYGSLQFYAPNDGGSTEFILDNNAAAGSTDEKVGIRLRHASATGAVISSQRTEDFASSAAQSANLFFQTTKDGITATRLTIADDGDATFAGGITLEGGHTITNSSGDLTLESAGDDINIKGSWLRIRNSSNTVKSAFHMEGQLTIGGDAQTTHGLKVKVGTTFLGDDVTIQKVGDAKLYLDANYGAGDSILYLKNTSDNTHLWSVKRASDGQFQIEKDGTDALVFDTSRNAYFAGYIYTNVIFANGSSALQLRSENSKGIEYLSDADGHIFKTYDGSWKNRFTIEDTGKANFLNYLQIDGGSSDAYTPTDYNDKPTLTLRSPNADTNYSNVRFTNTAGNYEKFIGSVQTSANTADIVFQGYDRGASAYKEYLRIKEDGSVGINKTPDTYQLDVAGSARFTNTSGNLVRMTGAGNSSFYVTATGQITHVSTTGNTAFSIDQQGAGDIFAVETSKFIIKADGKTGIGESTPLGKLHIYTGDSTYEGAADTGTDELVIESDGDAGLSILSPAGNKGGIFFSRNGQSTAGQINYHHVNDSPSNSMVFKTAATTALTLDASQNATFAGTINGLYINAGGIGDADSSGNQRIGGEGRTHLGGYIRSYGGNNGGKLEIYSGTSGAGTLAVTIGSDQSAIFAGNGVFTGGLIVNEGGGDNDFRVESDHNTNILHIQADGGGGSQGRVAFGTQTGQSTNCFFQVGGFINTWYGGGEQSGALFNTTVTAHAGVHTSGSYFKHTIVEPSSGTCTILSGVKVGAPDITAGDATVTNAATLYVTGAPSATVTGGLYAIYAPADTSYIQKINVGAGQIITPSGVNLALNPNTGLVTVGGSIQASSSQNVYLSLDTTQTNGDEWKIFNVVSGSDSQLQFKNEDTSEYPLVLQEGNKVGIGTTSPARPLHIDTSAHTYVRIESADTAKNSAIEFFDGTNYFYSGFMANESGVSAGEFSLYTGSSVAAMVIKQDGSTTFAGTLESTGTFTGTTIESMNGSHIQAKRNDGNNTNMKILNTHTGSCYLYLDASNGDLAGSDYALIYHDNSSLNLVLSTGDSAGSIVINSKYTDTVKFDGANSTFYGTVTMPTASPVQWADGNCKINRSSNDMHLYAYSGFVFSNNAGECGRFDNSGNLQMANDITMVSSSGDMTFRMDNNATNGADFKIMNGAGNSRADFYIDDNNHMTLKGQKVGINITAPEGTLHVNSASAGDFAPASYADDLLVENSGDGGLTIATPDANEQYILFSSPSNNGTYNALIYSCYNSNQEYLAFNTHGGGEVMRLDHNGNVVIPDKLGIGMSAGSTPSEALHVVGDVKIVDTHPAIDFTDSDDNSDSRIYHSAGSLYIDADNNNEVGSSIMRFSVDDSEVMRLVGGGNVGIGTTSPDTALTIRGNFDGSSGFNNTNPNKGLNISKYTGAGSDYGAGDIFGVTFTAASDSDTDYAFAGVYGEVDAVSTYVGGNIVFATRKASESALTEKVIIDSSGRMGIDVATPAQTLSVQGDTYDNIGILVGSTLYGLITAQSGDIAIKSSNSNNIVFHTAGTERLKITDTYAEWSRPLQINTTYSDEQIKIMGTSPYIRFYEGGTGKAYLQWHSDGKVLLENQETSSRMDMYGSLQFYAPNDGGSTEFILDNNAAAGSTDEKVGIRLRHASATGAVIFSERTEDFASSGAQSANLCIQTTKDGITATRIVVADSGTTSFYGNTGVSADSKYLRVGHGNDYTMMHDGTHTYVENSTGELRIYQSSTDWYSIWTKPSGGSTTRRLSISPSGPVTIGPTSQGDVTETTADLIITDATEASLYFNDTGATSGSKTGRFDFIEGIIKWQKMNDAGTSVTSTPFQIAPTGKIHIGDGNGIGQVNIKNNTGDLLKHLVLDTGNTQQDWSIGVEDVSNRVNLVIQREYGDNSWSNALKIMNTTAQIQGTNGSLSAPTYSFLNDTDTGLFLTEVGGIGISVAGSQALSFNSSLTATFGGDVYIPANLVHTGDGDTLIGFGDNVVQIEAGGTAPIRAEHSLVTMKAGSGVSMKLDLVADNGANHSDNWRLSAETDNVFEIQTKDGGSYAPVMELSASDKKVYFKEAIDVHDDVSIGGDLTVDGSFPFMIHASADWKGASTEKNIPLRPDGSANATVSTLTDLDQQMTWVAPFNTTLRSLYVTSETAVSGCQFKVEVATNYGVYVADTSTTTTTYTKNFVTSGSANISAGLSISKGNAIRLSIDPNSTAVDQFLVTLIFE